MAEREAADTPLLGAVKLGASGAPLTRFRRNSKILAPLPPFPSPSPSSPLGEDAGEEAGIKVVGNSPGEHRAWE